MSSSTREIITLQVGHYSNFVGSHWWNLQEASFNYDPNFQTDINHDYLFREGVTTTRQQTYTPRLLAIDAKGSLNNLASSGTLYETPRTPSPLEASWGGNVQLIHQLQSEKNDFLKDLERDDSRFLHSIDEDKDICIDDLNEQPKCESSPSSQKLYSIKKGVNVWSDYLHTHMHPKSVFMLNNLWHQQAEGTQGEVYWGFLPGAAIINKESNQEEIFDRIRLLAESCGSLQGFQILTDAHNGMAGVTCGIAQYLADEFSSKDKICFPITPPHFSAENIDVSSHYLTSLIQCYTEMSNLSSLVVPLNLKQHAWSTWAPVMQFPHLKLDNSSAYETSAVFATFLDTITMAYRSRREPLPLSHLAELLTIGGRKIAEGSLSFPIGLPSDTDLISWLKNDKVVETYSLSSGCDAHISPITQCQIIRGLDDSIPKFGPTTPPNSRFSNVADFYEQHLQKAPTTNPTRYIANVKDPVKTGKTYPRIFTEDVNERGYIDTTNTSTDVHSLPSIAGLHQGLGVAHLLHNLVKSGSDLNVSRLPRLMEDGVDSECWAEQMEVLNNLFRNYHMKTAELPESDDDDDDD